MESFLSTEIARLVYGYLVEESCQNAASLFLENSVHMHECLSVVRKGRRFSTKKCGKTLVEILEILADVTSLVRNFSENRESDLEEFLRNLVGLLIFVDEAQTVPRKLRNEDDFRCEQGLNYDSCLNVEKDPEQCNSPIQDPENSEDEYDIQNRPGLQVLLEKKEWHERLAENINKAVGSGNEAAEPEKLALEKVLEKKTVETIVNTFEADPIFEEILKELVGPVSRSSPSNADDTEQEGEETPIVNEENLEIPAAKNVQQETVAVPNSQANFHNEKSETTPHLGGFYVTGQNVENNASQQPHISVSTVQTSPQSSLTLIPIGKHSQLEKPTNPPLLKLTPTTSSGPPQPAQIVIQTSPAVQPGPATLRMPPPVSPQVVSIISTSGSPLLKDSTSTVSPIPCSVISRFEVVGPKVFFKKDPNSLPFHSKIHIQGETPPRPRLDILPKIMEPLKVQVEDSAQISPNAEGLQGNSDIPSEPVVIKRSGVRTRGGKRGGRKPQTRLKAIAPSLPKMETPLQLLIVSNDQQSKLPTVNTIEQLTNRPTALSCHTIQKGDAAPVVPSCEKESSENACNKIPSSIENKQIGQESFEKESTIPKLNVPQEEETKVTEECTPEQNNSSTVNFKERLSLSSPRRGSHVRTLEFNTPPKGINTRKANTSPKNSAKNRNVTQRLLRNFRRGGLFNSPSPTKSHEHVQNTESQSQCQVEQTVKPKKPNAWDSDLRVYTENEDIPTSVGLQRKRSANTKGKDKLTCADKISDKTDKPTPSNTYLCRIEEEDLNESSRCSLDGEDTLSKSNISTLEKEKTVVQSEISCVDGDFLNTNSANSDVKSTNEDNACHTPPDCLSPAHHLSLKNNTSLLASCTKSPGSSLESTLIKECARIENLNTNMLENEGLNKVNEKQHTFTTPFKIEQDVKMMSKNESYKFQTPAKTLLTPNSKQTVEMTPISQIRWEINELGKTKLVTPTLPQTPKDEVHLDEEVSPPSDKMTDISKESTVKVTKGKPKTVTKKTQRTKIQKKPSPNSTVVAVELGAKAKLKKCTKNRNIQEKDFDVEKTIKKCLKQAKNIIYGKGKGTLCNLSSETKEDDKSCGMKTRSRKAQTVNKSPTGIHDKSIPENVDEIESAKLPHQLKDPELVPKNVTRQIDIADEESGGSFPHLYLSEDEVTPTDSSQRISNVQVVSESSSVSKKIPSCHQNEKSSPCPSNDKKVTGENHEILLKNKLLVDNKTNNNIIVKNNIRNHIENFKYTFSVIDEDSGEYVSKDLKISPFLDLFELSPTNETRPSKYSDENKNKTKEEEVTKSKSSHQKEHVESNKKQEKRSFNFELSSDIDKRRRVRSSCSSNEEFDTQRRKRQCLSRSSYKEAYSQSARRKDYDRHFKERVPYSRRRDKTPFSSRRPRYSRDVEDSRKHSKSWSDERNDYRRKKSYNSPYKGNSSDWHLKDNFEEDAYNKSKDGRKTKPSEYYSKYPENRRSEKEDLLQLKSKEIQEIINQNKELNRRLQELEGNNKAHKQNESCKEEGELSDTTCSVSPKRKKPYSIFSNKKLSLVHSSSVAEDCRTTLLKELDVDSFLSIVHGSDENKPI